jgi:hypothetical protein
MRGEVPKRAVESASEFSRVRHQTATVGQTAVDEGRFDSSHSAVHHVAWSHTVRASLSIAQGYLGDPIHRF